MYQISKLIFKNSIHIKIKRRRLFPPFFVDNSSACFIVANSSTIYTQDMYEKYTIYSHKKGELDNESNAPFLFTSQIPFHP